MCLIKKQLVSKPDKLLRIIDNHEKSREHFTKILKTHKIVCFLHFVNLFIIHNISP